MNRRFTIKPTDLPAIAAFECVARHCSFTRAADELGVSTSALSQTVRKLERHLGVLLLRRTTRSVSPTDAGARFLAGIAPGLAQLHEACEALEGEGEAPRGLVRVALSRVTYTLFIAPHLARFGREHPHVRLEFGLSDGLSEVVGEGFDVGIRLGEAIPRDMITAPLGGPQRLVVVGAPEYFASRPRPTAPRDLLDHDCIRLRFVTSGRLLRWWLGTGEDEVELDVDGRIILNDMVAIAEAATAGLGLAQVFAGLVRAPLAEKRLVHVLQRHCAEFPGFSFYYPNRAHMPVKLRCFLDFFRAANRPRG
ncbi:LysR family transcriptional regulator [Nannocystis bainbridge]|uniref:LysR family transcriptional regulator n=1 Tax=Nannocystis bainbridge TaxID=2995303 RepID=A0ABT5DW72_9BACT|nr:LysR family transcriptional regulator [Nannocystis bainbridge]MDC0717831.1 LysR family transcriptional regulator [Nannocystis bainbridge]